MQILLNGQPHNLSQPMTLAKLLEQLGLAGKRLAVEHNLEIVPRSRYAELQLSEGDRLEIVHAIGGG